MGIFVIDASVLTKWFIEEKDTIMANKIREDYVTGKISLIAPSLLYHVFIKDDNT